MAVAKGLGEEETGKLLFKMVEFQFYKRIRVKGKTVVIVGQHYECI